MNTPIYDKMCLAISDCAGVFNELEALEDPKKKLAAYFAIARNLAPERLAADVRLRAERKYSRLLKKVALEGGALSRGARKAVSA